MLALFSTAFILFGAPAILLYAGRLIQSATDPVRREAARHGTVLTGSEWFCRVPAPLFGEGAAAPADPEAERVHAGNEEWFFRPMPPLVVWPDLRRLFRARRGAARV